jgi:hypothetical protein
VKKVSELYGKHEGEDIYVVGTGASLRVFPVDFLKDKITIGLNMAWKMAPTTYGITIHPDLNIPEFMPGEKPHPEITWVTGEDKCRSLLKNNPSHLQYALEKFYFFRYRFKENTQGPNQPSDSGRVLDFVEKPTDDWLYIWSSASQAGMNLAANLGAKNIILIGCDNAPLGENHHAHNQHTRWKGAAPNERYMQYYQGVSEVRTVLRKRGINVINMNPFVKIDGYEMDFAHLCDELGVPKVMHGGDISPKEKSQPIAQKAKKILKRVRSALR